jgi:hypothetical protein
MTIRCVLAALLFSGASLAFADPRTDYLLYCRGCHLVNGSGVPPEVPTLVSDIGKIVAIPGGREYIIRVPGVSQTAMNNDELSAVLNWVLAEFNADTTPENFAPYTSEEVGEARQKVLVDPLKFRASLLEGST